MSKSRRQRARDRKVKAFRLGIEQAIESMDVALQRYAARRSPEAMAREQEHKRLQGDRLRALFTPEYIQDMHETNERMAKISHEMSTWNGILQNRIRQYRPSGLGSYRTKRMRKKMYTHQQKELQARGL